MNIKHFLSMWLFLGSGLVAEELLAQTTYTEDFTGISTTNDWYFLNGACLTAGTSTLLVSPGKVPACTTVLATYYVNQPDHDQYLVGGKSGFLGSSTPPSNPAGQVADPVIGGVGYGALRFTNGYPYGHNENGAIISKDTFGTGQGIQVTFKTVTYEGDSGGAGNDGADGLSFFLLDGSKQTGIGAFGGSLAYSCSNSNPNYDGINGGYIGLGIDEYGNFLNGTNLVSGYTGPNPATGDNTAYGYGYKPGRIGMRGAGSVSWKALNDAYGSDPNNSSKPYYPSSLSIAERQAAVQHTCATGHLYNYKNNAPQDAGAANIANVANTAKILDYAPIPGAYAELTGFQIANESATKRSDGLPIIYNLKVTQDGLLSLSYARYNGTSYGAFSYVIKNQSITASNGTLPGTFRFGFAGSSGGSTNVHEIMCFRAAPVDQSGSSATVNEKQAAKVEAGTQAYFAFYNPNNWTGSLTANTLIDTAGVISVSTTANWDASCLLTGTPSGAPAAGGGCPTTNVSGPTSASPSPGSRVMLTWDTQNATGIPFEWSSLNSNQQATLDARDATSTQNRFNYLRGDRSNEINTAGVGLYRAREGLLGDIVDSSPNWVGPPSSPYTARWKDRLNPATVMPENGGTQNYVQFIAAEQQRLNVVYGGSNDGFLHGFRAGYFNNDGNYVGNDSTKPNDGQEVLAYMPGSVLVSGAAPSSPGGCTDNSHTGSIVQNIHGVTPAIGGNALCVDPTLDLSSAQYGHNFFVDATPGTGDLFYGGVWHTWLVGGLGIGGAAIYALDVTDPSSTSFTEARASSIVKGEWNASSITCANVSNCGRNLGNTFGTPQIRRLHNGTWGVIFGNGFSSQTGDAGIFVMSIDGTTGAKTFYYLSTGTSSGSGIAYATPADLDGDHITDYVYAGDLKGNVWRFDLTNTDPTQWAASSAPLFTARDVNGAVQPISSQLLVVSNLVPGAAPRLLIEFGTGQRTQLSNVGGATYNGTSPLVHQSLYGIWDWNLTNWNTNSAVQYASLASSATGLSSPYTLTSTNLQSQTFTANAATGVRDGTNNTVCWKASTTCGAAAASNPSFGWYGVLPGTAEQVIFNPVFYQGAFVVNTTVPASNTPTSCTVAVDTGFTYGISIANGGIFNNAFPTFTKTDGTLVSDSTAAAIQTNATGSVYVVTTAENTSNIVYQTVSGTPGAQKVNFPSNTKAKRLTWVERR